jgi:glucose-1-phosphatase
MFRNIIFDLGGVILDLSVPATIVAFSKASGLDPETVKKLFVSSEGFLAYERGEIDDLEFRSFVRSLFKVNLSDAELDACWNAMLLTIDERKVELLLQLKKNYNTFLLSNTNTIHVDYINANVIPKLKGVRSLEECFHKTYYSHLMKKRKPEAEIFQQVLDENNLDAADTIFLDDNADNIAGARAVGIQTAFVDSPDFILNYFHEHRTA